MTARIRPTGTMSGAQLPFHSVYERLDRLHHEASGGSGFWGRAYHSETATVPRPRPKSSHPLTSPEA
jgi:hypothetical protein